MLSNRRRFESWILTPMFSHTVHLSSPPSAAQKVEHSAPCHNRWTLCPAPPPNCFPNRPTLSQWAAFTHHPRCPLRPGAAPRHRVRHTPRDPGPLRRLRPRLHPPPGVQPHGLPKLPPPHPHNERLARAPWHQGGDPEGHSGHRSPLVGCSPLSLLHAFLPCGPSRSSDGDIRQEFSQHCKWDPTLASHEHRWLTRVSALFPIPRPCHPRCLPSPVSLDAVPSAAPRSRGGPAPGIALHGVNPPGRPAAGTQRVVPGGERRGSGGLRVPEGSGQSRAGHMFPPPFCALACPLESRYERIDRDFGQWHFASLVFPRNSPHLNKKGMRLSLFFFSSS